MGRWLEKDGSARLRDEAPNGLGRGRKTKRERSRHDRDPRGRRRRPIVSAVAPDTRALVAAEMPSMHRTMHGAPQALGTRHQAHRARENGQQAEDRADRTRDASHERRAISERRNGVNSIRSAGSVAGGVEGPPLARGRHDRAHVVAPLLERRQRAQRHRIGDAGAALVEAQQSCERPPAGSGSARSTAPPTSRRGSCPTTG